MNRLTARTDNGTAYITSETGEEGVGHFTTQRRLPELISRLAAYEDTGFSPEEIYQAIAMLYCPLCGARMDENDNACAAATQRPPDNYVGEAAVEYGAPFDEPL